MVYGDRKHWTQKNADHGDRDRSCSKGRYKPNYQLEAFMFEFFFYQKIITERDLQNREEGINVDGFDGSDL